MHNSCSANYRKLWEKLSEMPLAQIYENELNLTKLRIMFKKSQVYKLFRFTLIRIKEKIMLFHDHVLLPCNLRLSTPQFPLFNCCAKNSVFCQIKETQNTKAKAVTGGYSVKSCSKLFYVSSCRISAIKFFFKWKSSCKIKFIAGNFLPNVNG